MNVLRAVRLSAFISALVSCSTTSPTAYLQGDSGVPMAPTDGSAAGEGGFNPTGSIVTVSGIVHTSSGQPAQNVAVYVVGDHQAYSTDDKGMFSIQGVHVPYDLAVSRALPAPSLTWVFAGVTRSNLSIIATEGASALPGAQFTDKLVPLEPGPGTHGVQVHAKLTNIFPTSDPQTLGNVQFATDNGAFVSNSGGCDTSSGCFLDVNFDPPFNLYATQRDCLEGCASMNYRFAQSSIGYGDGGAPGSPLATTLALVDVPTDIYSFDIPSDKSLFDSYVTVGACAGIPNNPPTRWTVQIFGTTFRNQLASSSNNTLLTGDAVAMPRLPIPGLLSVASWSCTQDAVVGNANEVPSFFVAGVQPSASPIATPIAGFAAAVLVSPSGTSISWPTDILWNSSAGFHGIYKLDVIVSPTQYVEVFTSAKSYKLPDLSAIGVEFRQGDRVTLRVHQYDDVASTDQQLDPGAHPLRIEGNGTTGPTANNPVTGYVISSVNTSP